ncbi:MAG: hypothetical protein AAFX99_11060, partial [Myxococcota bacterium]
MAQLNRWIPTLVAAFMALALTDCGDEESSSDPGHTSSSTTTGSSSNATSNGIATTGDATSNGTATTGADAGSSGTTLADTGVADPTPEEPEAPALLELEPSQPPIALPPGVIFYSNVPYGDDPRLNAFDIMLPDSDEPTPLIVYIHGGGFTGGDKLTLFNRYEAEIERWLTEGIAVATINYRLLRPNDSEGVHKSLGDSRYCLQYMRYHANSLNIDPEHVAL